MKKKTVQSLLRWGLPALIFALCLPAGLMARGGEVEFIQLRITGDSDPVVIEMPVSVLEFLGKAEGEDIDIHLDDGRKVRIPMDKLTSLIRKKSKRGEETLLFSVEEPGRDPVNFYGMTYAVDPPSVATVPSYVVLRSTKPGEEPTRIRLSLSLVELFCDLIDSDGGDSSGDFMPFIRSCLATATTTGLKDLLRIESKDEVLTLSLE